MTTTPAGTAPAAHRTDGPDRTRALAAFACGLEWSEVPERVRLRIQLCLLDFLGVSLHASHTSEPDGPLASLGSVAGTRGACTVIGRGTGHSVEMAALSNGTLAHWFDFDDTNVEGLLHPGACVIPAALAFGEHASASGRTVLEALVAGYEVAARVGAALGETAYDRGFHITPVAGVFGATVAAGVVAGLDAEQMVQACGFAGSQAAGSMQYLAAGSWNKRFQPGFAARAAIDSVALVQGGAIGSIRSIEGRWGLLTGYSDSPRPELLTEDLGGRWLTLSTGIKPYPSCRFTHGAIDASLAIRRQRRRWEPRGPDFPDVKVRLSSRAYQIVGEPQPSKLRPVTLVDAQFSVYFQVATALLHGPVTPASYDELESPELLRMIDRVQVSVGNDLEGLSAEVEMRGEDEELLGRSRCDVPAGEPPDGVTDEVVQAKFSGLAVPILGDRVAGEVIRCVMDPESGAGPARLLAMLSGEDDRL